MQGDIGCHKSEAEVRDMASKSPQFHPGAFPCVLQKLRRIHQHIDLTLGFVPPYIYSSTHSATVVPFGAARCSRDDKLGEIGAGAYGVKGTVAQG